MKMLKKNGSAFFVQIRRLLNPRVYNPRVSVTLMLCLTCRISWDAPFMGRPFCFFRMCLHLAVLALHCLSLASGEPGDFNYICYGWRPTLSEIDKATHNNYTQFPLCFPESSDGQRSAKTADCKHTWGEQNRVPINGVTNEMRQAKHNTQKPLQPRKELKGES